MAGTTGGKKSADYMFETWTSQNLDEVQMIDYDVLLSYPDENLYNNIQIKNAYSSIETVYEIKEQIYDPNISAIDFTKSFLAYGMNGTVSSNEIYFANYCRDIDFNLLLKSGCNLKNKIILCKYGKIFRGNKVYFRYFAFENVFKSNCFSSFTNCTSFVRLNEERFFI